MRKKLTVATLVALTIWLVPPFVLKTTAAELASRSLTISDSMPNAPADHLYAFDFQSTSNVGSIVFEYCANTAVLNDACTVPIGLNASSASLAFQAGEENFAIHPSTTANRIVINRASTMTTPGSAQYLFSNVINHSQENSTVYVRIYTHASEDGTGAYTDAGAVAYSTASKITVGAFVPPYLLFCVGITVALDCSSASGNYIQLGELQPSSPSTATSQYSGATNDYTGYSVSVIGNTMTSGNNVIPELNNPSPSSTGQSQFGINLRDNSFPDVGIDPIGPGSAVAAPSYGAVNNYKFNTGDSLSSSSTSSSYDRFTVSYIVNVNAQQPAGIYNTTLTYVAVASF